MGLSICSIGSAIIQTSTSAYVYVHNVLHVTSITKNLISVSKLLADNNVFIEFHHNIYFVKAKSTKIILLKGIAKEGLYQVENLAVDSCNTNSHVSKSRLSKSVYESISTSIRSPLPMFTQMSSSSVISSGQKPVNISQFNRNVSMAFIAFYIKSVDYNLLHKRMGHPTVHALKQIMKRLDTSLTV